MTAAHHRFRAALLASAAAVLTLAVAFLPALRSYAEPPPEVLQAVHTDALHTTYDGSVLRLNSRIGLGEYREADPAGLIFNLEDKASARVELPDLPAFAFLGKPGDSVWIAPESQDPELIWPGWDTETIAPGVLAGDVVDLTLLEASGPGHVEVFFNYDEFTGVAQRVFSSVDPAIRVLRQPVGRHVHANWSFSQLGTYRLTFQASATTAAGAPLSSGPVTYTFVVGPYVPPTATPPTTPPTTPPGTPPTTPPVTPPATGTPPTTPPGTPPTTPPTQPTPPTTPPTTGPTQPTPPPTSPPTTPSPSPSPRPTTAPTSTPTQQPTSPRPSSGGDAENNSNDSPPNPNPTSTPSGNLPPCITTPTPSAPNATTPGSTPSTPGSTNSTDPTTTPGATTPPPTTPPTGGDPARTTLSNGHADYAVRLEGGKLASRVKDGTKPGTPVWRDPAKVTIRLTAAAKTQAPGGAFAFLGPAGAPLWQIPQTQKDGVIWLGWNTEELTPAQLSTGVDWRLDRVTGPGKVAVFEFDSFGRPKIIFNSGDGLPDTYRIPLGTHAHGNWSFTQPGTYQATFTHTATLTTGARSTTTSTLTFVITTTSSAPGGAAHPAAASGADTGTRSSQVALAVGEPAAHGAAYPAAVDAGARNAAAAGSGGCKLASTGAEIGPGWIGGGAALVVIGVVVLVATRRRGDV